MARFYWCFFVICAFLLISVSGQSDNEKFIKSNAVLPEPKGKCPENEICDSGSKNGKMEVSCQEPDANGNCRDAACADGQELDPATGECREMTKCEGESCDEKMQKMQESPKRMRSTRSKKGLHIAMILKKKKHLMMMKPKPKPPPPPHHHGHHGHHHHHSSEEEEEEEEEAEAEQEEAPAPEIRLYNAEICLDGTSNCMNSTVAPETTAENGNGAAKPGRPRKEKPTTQPDPAEANVRKRVIRFLKVLRMRRRLSPFLGRLNTNSPTISPEEKKRK